MHPIQGEVNAYGGSAESIVIGCMADKLKPYVVMAQI